MKFLKQKSKRKGYERFWDYYIVWVYQDRVYSLRVNPCFSSDLKLMFAAAETVPQDTPIDEYVLPPC
jgi:hypothetical protein